MVVLGVEALVARLDDAARELGPGPLDGAGAESVGDRQRSLRASLGVSWDLLDARLSLAASACGLFAARFPATLAEALLRGVCDDPLGALVELRARALLHAAADEGSGEPSLSLGRVVRDHARRALSATRDAAALTSRFGEVVSARALALVHEPLRGAAVPPSLLDMCDDLEAITTDDRHGLEVRARARWSCAASGSSSSISRRARSASPMASSARAPAAASSG